MTRDQRSEQSDIPKYRVERWLDEDLLDEVSEIEVDKDEDVDYKFGVMFAGLGLNIIKRKSGSESSPLLIASKMELSREHLDTFSRLSGVQRNDIISQIGAVLTNSPGIYRFTDGMGNDVDFESLRAIRIEHRIYPDSLSQDRLMNSIIDVVNALVYVRMVFSTYLSNLESQA